MKGEAAFARCNGTAPKPASSGQTIRHRLSRGGDRQANNALHTIARIRACHDEQTRAYLDRRVSEGKTPREAMRAPVSKDGTSLTWTFKLGVGEQSLYGEYFDGAKWEPLGRIILSGVIKLKFTSRVEVRPCNEPGAKEEGLKVIPCENEEPLPYTPDELDWVDELPLP